MEEEILNYEKLSWAVFIVSTFGETGPNAYMSIYADKDFRMRLVHNPQELDLVDIQDRLIGGFINKWRTRCPNNEESAQAIRKALVELSPVLKALEGLSIESVDFDKVITVEPYQGLISDAIAAVFERIAWAHGYKAVMAAKAIGILNPELFVMWDGSIALHYEVSFNGKGYVEFLKKMQSLGRECLHDFRERFKKEDLANHLSQRLGYNPPKTLAKYVDEYNWITITKKVRLPPKWHPCDDKPRF